MLFIVVTYNVSLLQVIDNFGTDYLLVTIKIIEKSKREITTKLAIT